MNHMKCVTIVTDGHNILRLNCILYVDLELDCRAFKGFSIPALLVCMRVSSPATASLPGANEKKISPLSS